MHQVGSVVHTELLALAAVSVLFLLDHELLLLVGWIGFDIIGEGFIIIGSTVIYSKCLGLALLRGFFGRVAAVGLDRSGYEGLDGCGVGGDAVGSHHSLVTLSTEMNDTSAVLKTEREEDVLRNESIKDADLRCALAYDLTFLSNLTKVDLFMSA